MTPAQKAGVVIGQEYVVTGKATHRFNIGEVPEAYADKAALDVALTKNYHYYTGRTDCPERVIKRFEKQKYEDRYNREATKDCLDTSYSATVYLRA